VDTAMTAEGMRVIAAYIDAAKTARHLAHEYRRMAVEYPKHATDELAESARAFNRARYYLWQARMWRAQ
jgi:hypothetical protein